tara:strand:+ start:122913 stop:123746 length:834 start_codon:yes stop_codon:yes gene_type:complete
MKCLILLSLVFLLNPAWGAVIGKESRRTQPDNRLELEAMAATVRIKSSEYKSFLGTGVLVRDSNILLTNWHVLYDEKTGDKRSKNPLAQINPLYHSEAVGVNWDNAICNEEKDYCVIELKKHVPSGRGLPVAKHIPDSFAHRPQSMGLLVVSNFSMEMLTIQIEELTDEEKQSPSQKLKDILQETNVKKVQVCAGRDFDELFGSVKGDCDNRQGNSGSGVVASIRNMGTLVGFVHAQAESSSTKDNDPYNPDSNAVSFRVITSDINADINTVLSRSR